MNGRYPVPPPLRGAEACADAHMPGKFLADTGLHLRTAIRAVRRCADAQAARRLRKATARPRAPVARSVSEAGSGAALAGGGAEGPTMSTKPLPLWTPAMSTVLAND